MRNLPALLLNILLLLACAAPVAAQDASLKIVNLIAPIPPKDYSYHYKADIGPTQPRRLNHQGVERSYYLAGPDAASHEPHAAIVLLHGAKRTGASMIDTWRDIGLRNNLVLIAPNGMNRGWGMKHDGPDFLRAVLAEVVKSYKIDPARLYLFGHSMGANHALYIMLFDSSLYTAAAVHAGAFYNMEHAEYVGRARRGRPIAIFNGTHDPLFPMERVLATARAINAGKFDVVLYKLLGHTHWYYDIADFINERAWKFLQQDR